MKNTKLGFVLDVSRRYKKIRGFYKNAPEKRYDSFVSLVYAIEESYRMFCCTFGATNFLV